MKVSAPFITLFCLFFFTVPLDAASDLSQLYDRTTLESWGSRYKQSTTRILDEVIWPALFSAERRHFQDQKPPLVFPLWAEGEARGHPLAFYVPGSGDRIVLPVFSLKFLDDLCTAYAWLQVNGYGLETISEYTAILKYGAEPPGGFPSPLKALHIPENALDDPKVDELALGHFVTARTFLLLHEMGHILYGHQARTFAESIRNEQQADAFATNVMGRTPLPPLGMLVFFLTDAHWSGFPPSGRDTHPMSGERVGVLADAVDDPGLAQKLRALGKLFDDPDIRAGFVATGKAGDLGALAPRRPGELPRVQRQSLQGERTALFDGVYRGEYVQLLDPNPMAIAFDLERQDERVQGRYTFGAGFGTIEGQVVDKQLYFDWEWSGNYGKGVLEGRDDGNFAGTWGYREARSGGGTLTGRRDVASGETQAGGQQGQDLKQYLSGRRFLVSYRDGGAAYGTYFMQEVHFCPSGQYRVLGQSRKQTVMGNEQVNNWEDAGTWQVIAVQGQAAVQYLSASGKREVVPVRILPEGRLWIREGVSIRQQGRAQCR